MSAFAYVVTGTGELSGPSFVSQTEAAINELGGEIGDNGALARQALDAASAAQTSADSAAQAASTAQQNAEAANGAANTALADAAVAQTTANAAGNAAGAAQSSADSAAAAASAAQNSADNAASAASAAQGTANTALSASASASSMAAEAQGNLQVFADGVNDLLPQALGQFAATDAAVDANDYATTLVRLLLLDSSSTNLPTGVSFPAYFWNFLASDETRTLQWALTADGSTLYKRSAGITPSAPNAGTDAYALTVTDGDNASLGTGTLTATAANSVVSLSAEDLTWYETAQPSGGGAQTSFTGTLTLSTSDALTDGAISLGGTLIASVSSGVMTMEASTATLDNSSAAIDGVSIVGTSVLLTITLNWTNLTAEAATWTAWTEWSGGAQIPATTTTLGSVIVGSGLSVAADGTLSSSGGGSGYTLPTASATELGGVKVGANLSMDASGVLSANSGGYTLPTASDTVLGGVMVGDNLSVDASGVLSAAGDYLPLSGGSLTGGVTFGKSVFETAVAMPAAEINVSLGTVFTKTISGATTLTVTNAPSSGSVGCFTLILTNGGAYAVSWPASFKWPGGTAPALTASGTDALTFLTVDGGASWLGSALLGVA